MKDLDKALEMIQGAAQKETAIVGIAGGSCSGKTTLASELERRLGARILKMDDYYKGHASVTTEKFDHNFDEPAAIDMELLAEHLGQLKRGLAIEKPLYNFTTHSRSGYESFFSTGKIIVLDGLFCLHDPVKEQLDVKIFVDCPEEMRLERRLKRDMEERGRTRESVLHQFRKTVKPMHELHIEPTKRHAHVVVVNDGEEI
ncbi:MAG: uridine kinase [Candidatus Aenigmarchaeota archaeon]|nr:uridine kinase [Candidatus Aenigmarchaeota archaeon]